MDLTNARELHEFYKRLTPVQMKMFNRLSKRLVEDIDGSFAAFIDGQGPILRSFVNSEDIDGFDRWMRRRSLTLIQGGKQ